MYCTDVEKAKNFAQKVHAEQTDKAGVPYVGHLSRVAQGVDSDEAKVVAWLHDCIKDQNVTLEQILDLFGEETAKAVDCLTRREEESYTDYLVRAKSNPISRVVKIADLLDNSNLSRLPFLTFKDLERQKKYNDSLKYLLTCCTFYQQDAQLAAKSMDLSWVKGYGDEGYVFDEGGRTLYRCKKCGCLLLNQRSEYHGLEDDDHYCDYYPVASVEDADRIHRQYGAMVISSCTKDRYLLGTNGKYSWRGPNEEESKE